MNAEELLERFVKLESDGEVLDTPKLYLSRDRVLGIPRYEDSLSRFISFGSFKLKGKRYKQRIAVKVANELYFNIQLLYRAMRVLKSRKKFQLGIFEMEVGEVFAIRKGDNIILIAPLVYAEPKPLIEFKDLVERGKIINYEKWNMWRRILHGKR